MLFNADKVSYDDSEGNVYAEGHVELISNSQGVTLKADEAVLDKASQTIKLSGNVKIVKDGFEPIPMLTPPDFALELRIVSIFEPIDSIFA